MFLELGVWVLGFLWNLALGVRSFAEWLPLVLMPAAVLLLRAVVPAWAFMWLLALAIFFACKWLTWRRACRRGLHPPIPRSLAYLLAWPGMDAIAFLKAPNPKHHAPKKSQTPNPERQSVNGLPVPMEPPRARQRSAFRRLRRLGAWNLGFLWRLEVGAWSFAVAKTLCGAALIWIAAHRTSGANPLLTGWLGMIGVVFLLHFGLFHLLALAWQRAGVHAQPLMRSPFLATSLAEFWSARWNTAFHLLAQDVAFRPLARRRGPTGATIGVFLISGLVHEAVISLPARGGFGLPTAYFVLQGLGVLAERARWGRRLGLGRGLRGWLFALICAAGPAFWLFHPPFIHHVILPMLQAIGAT